MLTAALLAVCELCWVASKALAAFCTACACVARSLACADLTTLIANLLGPAEPPPLGPDELDADAVAVCGGPPAGCGLVGAGPACVGLGCAGLSCARLGF